MLELWTGLALETESREASVPWHYPTRMIAMAPAWKSRPDSVL